MTPNVLIISKEGKFTNFVHINPGDTFVVNPEDANDAYTGSIYATRRGRNATGGLVGTGNHTIKIGVTYTILFTARDKIYTLTTTLPADGPDSPDSSVPADDSTDAPPQQGSNGDLYVGS